MGVSVYELNICSLILYLTIVSHQLSRVNMQANWSRPFLTEAKNICISFMMLIVDFQLPIIFEVLNFYPFFEMISLSLGTVVNGQDLHNVTLDK